MPETTPSVPLLCCPCRALSCPGDDAHVVFFSRQKCATENLPKHRTDAQAKGKGQKKKDSKQEAKKKTHAQINNLALGNEPTIARLARHIATIRDIVRIDDRIE